jgi:hypothetical protein
MNPRNFFAELKRRNVVRMAGLYLVGAWLLTQVSSRRSTVGCTAAYDGFGGRPAEMTAQNDIGGMSTPEPEKQSDE